MRISIAMATYNGATYLQDQLDSFVNQTRLPDELVVCDDSSTDSTLDILETFRQKAPFDVRVYRNNTNLGYIRNFEKALSYCKGDLVFLSDQDDVWKNSKLSIIASIAEQNPEFDVIVNDADYVNANLIHSGVSILSKLKALGSNEYGQFAGACTMITKEFRDFIIPFPKENCPPHDAYIHRWAYLMRNKLVVHDSLQSYRIHGQNTSDTELSNEGKATILERYKKFKNKNLKTSYLLKANDFMEMERILRERRNQLRCLHSRYSEKKIRLKINQIKDAHINRSALYSLNWFERKRLILVMLIKGHYKYFDGIRSVTKDLLR